MSELLRREADAGVKLHFEPLAGIGLGPLAVDALVLFIGPGILEFVQLEALVLQAFDIRPDALSVAGLPVLKGVPDHVMHKRNSFFWGALQQIDTVVDLLLDAVAAFQAVLEANQVAIWILTFDGAQRWRDLFLLPSGDRVACCFNPAVLGWLQEPVALAAPGARRIIGSVDRRAFFGRPLPLVLRPHPAGLLGRPIPLLRRGLLPGRGPLRRNRLLRGNRHTQVGVILLPMTRLDLDTTGPARPAAATTLIVPMICAPIGRQFGVIGLVNSHRV